MSPDGWLALNQIDREAGIGNFKCGLNPSDATTHDQGGGVNGYFERGQRFLMDHAGDTASDDGLGLFGRSNLIRVDPGVLFTNGDQFAQVRV